MKRMLARRFDRVSDGRVTGAQAGAWLVDSTGGGSEVCNLHTEVEKFALLKRAAKILAGEAET
jgi:hypothetical protein